MVMTAVPAFAQTPRLVKAVATAAVGNIATDTPTNVVELMLAGAKGSLLTKLSAMPRATATANSLVLFITKADESPTPHSKFALKDSALMAAYAMSATTEIVQTLFSKITPANPIRLGAGDKLWIGTQVALASGVVFVGEGADF
ncbi:hypothetical protein [Pseudomonas fluorescens]|uniref:Uncharacterized protein n=1 Tax=Pseudomonas fluorescens TaxID=294 RepID=A0A5E7FZN0_PSEFL|nr:hypothetical protein [Pseudomonas fluorescens]VVO44304.1 hypothetical protein PS723_06342 [Pseudomonas fluorescens]